MKIGVLLIAGLFAIMGARSLPAAQTPDDKAHQQWLEARYQEAISIVPGMTRSELEKLFYPEGGIVTTTRRYALKSCFLIHIEVKFDEVSGAGLKAVPDKDAKIIEVSHPFLARIILD